MSATIKRWFGKSPDISAVIARFPVPVICMAVFTILMIIFKDDFVGNKAESIGRLMVGLVVAAYLCVSTVLISETHNKGQRLPLQIGIVFIVGVLAWFSKELRLNLPMAVGAAILLLGNAIIWRQKRDDLHVWDFTHKLWTGAVFAAVGSFIFALGMLAIQEALRSLFGLNIRDLVGDILLPVGLGFLAPLYWMATLPPVDEDYSELYDNPGFVSKAVTFLGTWLLSPLTLIYALILLAYGVKIVMTGELPKGEIAELTSPFLIIGTLTWLVLDPPFAKNKALAKLFRKLWWPVSIPAALLLAVAVFVRINEYGYTPERFALTALIVWALGLALWFTFAPKEKRDIRLIPGFAAVLLAGGAIGAGWLSHVNQSQRFETGLKASGIITAQGEISGITNEVAAKRAKGALDYLTWHQGEERVKDVLKKLGVKVDDSAFKDKQVSEALGLDKVSLAEYGSNINSLDYRRAEQSMSVAGFDTVHGPLSFYTQKDDEALIATDGAIDARIKSGILSLKFDTEVIEFDLRAWVMKQRSAGNTVSFDDPTVMLLDTPDRSIKLVMNYFAIWFDVNETGGNGGDFNGEIYLLTRGIE